MIRILLSLHKLFYSANNRHRYKGKNWFMYVVCNVGYRMCEVMLWVLWGIKKMLGIYPQPLSAHNRIVVSFTSFPKRINTVWMVVESMFRQKMRPDKVCLYLTKEEFPEGKSSLPKRLLGYEKLGLEIKFVDTNLMPHNKYFYGLQEFPDSYVITVDDDMYYHDNLISNLWSIHQKHQDCVCSNTIDIITFEDNGSFKPTSQWVRPYSEVKPSLLNLALGYDGVLYPTSLFKDAKDFFNIKLIKTLSPKADDMWLRALELYNGIPVANGNYFCSGVNLPGAQVVSLMSFNCGAAEGSTAQWRAMDQHFNLRALCDDLH